MTQSNNTNQTALLVMDMQNSIVERFVKSPADVAPLQQAMAAARAKGLQVIFVRVAFREGYPEVSPNNKAFSGIAERNGMNPLAGASEIHESVAPLAGEPIVTKVRVSAFAGSDLEVILRSRSITTLVLTGIATSGVVLSTLREAADKDYRIVALRDACLDADEEVHRVLMDKVFPRQADVLTAEEWIGTLD